MTDDDSPVAGRIVRRGLFLAAATAVLLAVAAGGVAAHDNVPAEPGASGHCADNDSGGAFAFHGPGDHENNFVGPAEAQSAGAMAVYFAETQGDCGGGNETYLEAHVISAAVNAQYCYDERSDGDEGDAGRGDEPTDNATASNGLGEVNVNDGSRNHPPGDEENENGESECEYNAHNKDDGSGGGLALAGHHG